MKYSKLTVILSAVCAVALLVAACDDDGDGPQPDVTNDVSDVVADQTEDPTEDAAPDAEQDPVVDPVVDSGIDAVADIVPDPTIDAVETGNLFINEFIVTPTGEEAIELYNADSTPVSLNGWSLEHTDSNGQSNYSFNNGLIVPASGFLNIPKADFGQSDDPALTNSGATLVLKDGDGTIIDEVGYGALGLAPAPIYQWSTARVTDGGDTGDDAVDFNIDPTPTMGAANDVAGVDLGGTDVVINEFMIDDASDTADFFEFYNMGTSTADISDWLFIYAGDDYVFSSNTTVASSGFLAVEEADYPEFSDPGPRGNAYLFDDAGVRYQGISWQASATSGAVSSGFFPDGAIDAWAGVATDTGLRFDLTPTPSTANIE